MPADLSGGYFVFRSRFIRLIQDFHEFLDCVEVSSFSESAHESDGSIFIRGMAFHIGDHFFDNDGIDFI